MPGTFDFDSVEEDFPAAHSMDTTWFAVDKDGFLAVMESGGCGAVPLEFGSREAEDFHTLRILSDEFGDCKFADKAIYRYNCDSEWTSSVVDLYRRTIQNSDNDSILKFEDLDEDLQTIIKPFRVSECRFEDLPAIQPVFRTPCVFLGIGLERCKGD